jgi:hypothetical protein
MRKMMLLAALVAIATLMLAAAPAFADDNNHDHHFNHFFFDPFNNGVSQDNEQDVESGDATQNIGVTGGGDNSNQCVGVQGVTNTGNATNNTSVLQAGNPFSDGFNNDRFFDNRFDRRFDDGRFFFDPFFFDNNGFNNGSDVEIQDSGNFTISPSQTTTCTQQVNQAATAAG